MDGIFRSRGDTILGADNKAAVTVLIELAARHASRPAAGRPRAGVHRRRGGRAAGSEGARRLVAALAIRLRPRPRDPDRRGDHRGADVQPARRRIRGHGGARGHPPEDGRSAIAAAAAAIAAMELGPARRGDDGERRRDRGRHGVERRRRELPDRGGGAEPRRAEGRRGDRRRSSTPARGRQARVAATSTSTSSRCSAATGSLRARRQFASPRQALERVGVEPREAATGGGSDANALIAQGFECVLLANGTEANHTPQESVAAARIVQMLDVCEAIAELAADARRGLMLKLRRGIVVGRRPAHGRGRGGDERAAWADAALVGEVGVGDEVVVNVEARRSRPWLGRFRRRPREPEPGARGRRRRGRPRDEAELYLAPAPRRAARARARRRRRRARADAGARGPCARPPRAGGLGGRAGSGRAPHRLPPDAGRRAAGLALARRRRAARARADRGARHGRVRPTGASTRRSASSGGIDAAARVLGWDAVVAGPGPGILGSATALGHGGIAALDTAHAALALGLPTLLAPRLSSSDPRPRHRGLSHHSRTVLELLLAPVRVPVPEIETRGLAAPRTGCSRGRLARGGARGPDRATKGTPRPRRRARGPRRVRGRAGCRRGRWAATSTRIRSSSRPPWRPAAALAGGGVAWSGWSAPTSHGGPRARSDARRRWRYADGGEVASARSPRSRRRDDRRPTTRASSTWSASRARPWASRRLLELPAGKLDVEGESPLECAKRELVEEIGGARASGRRSSASTRHRDSQRRR